MLAHLAADRALVTDIDAKILDLERSIFALRTEKQLVQERLNSYKYPVLTLPNELTVEIFIHFLPPYPDYSLFTGHDSPTLLAQVCRQWREIALETPTLWRAMSLSDPNDIDDELHASEILAAVVPHRTRWEYLDLDLSPSHIAIIQGPMPLLCCLDLTLDDGTISFREAPSLRSITLRATPPSKIAFPLQQITSLTLHLTSNLVHCELSIHAIELPRLESLAWLNEEPPDRAGFLGDFLVPALRSLRIDESFLEPAPIDELASFISKSSCKLQQVCVRSRIEGLVVSKASYREAFPSIHRFSFGDESHAASIPT
ncbi:hypothetical protein K438DRAFT_1891089, partial [Mycena galopus ATCC 62051]